MGRRLVFDIETDNLLFQCTRCWVICCIDIDTLEEFDWINDDLGWIDVFNEADLLIGHNIISFDLNALQRLYGYKYKKNLNIHDTLLMSLILDYNRGGHSLEWWGDSLGYPKDTFNDFSKYSPELHHRCKIDVRLNLEVYNKLLAELLSIKDPNIKNYMRVEHAVAKWCAKAEYHGWPFNKDEAIKLFDKLEIEVENTRQLVQPLLGMKAVAVDKCKGVVEPKKPKWIKNGGYAASTANWFNILWESGADDDRLVEGPYSRVVFKELDIDSTDDVKIFLNRNGWVPLEYNSKFDPVAKRKIKTSPKITLESLEPMQGHGKVYCEFLTNKSRRDILKGWIDNVDENGFLHGTCFTIGTPSMRARHNIIVNVPSADSVYGPEMRSLFGALPGWKLIGCDSAGNQARGLAHYLKNKTYTDLLLNGDIHTSNAEALTSVLSKLGYKHVVTRAQAKRINYAFLFGAAGDKMISYTWPGGPDIGNKFKNGFSRAVPGLSELLDYLGKIYGQTYKFSDGYIYGLGGNKIYCDSFHKLLVYFLQACEKVTCGSSVMLTMERLEKADIEYIPCIFMHDEIQFMVLEEDSLEAAEISKQTFIDGPRMFGVDIMDGNYKIGNNWFDTH